MAKKKKTEELNERELDQITGGLGHELTHTVQQGGTGISILTSNLKDEIDSGTSAPSGRTDSIVKSGGGSDI